MKTLIINGSPRAQGGTASMISKLLENLQGEYRIVDTYHCNVSACLDCRYCWEHQGCAIQDEMQEIYDYIQECDNVVLASPVYLSEVTGKVLDFGSRLQTYFCSRFFRKEEPISKAKRGAIMLVGGGDQDTQKPYHTACMLMHHMNCFDICQPAYGLNTNLQPALEYEGCLEGIDRIVQFLNDHDKNIVR